MATIKFLLQSEKSNTPIYLRLSLGKNKSFKRKTKLLGSKKNWNFKDGLPKSNSEDNKQIRKRLNQLREKIYDRYNEDIIKNKEITSNWVKHEIAVFFEDATNNKVSNTVCGYIKHIIKNAHIRPNSKGGIGIGKSRIGQYKRLSELFEEFYGNKDCKISEVDVTMFNKFRSWFVLEKEFDKNSTYISKKLNDLKSVCKEAYFNHNVKIADNLMAVKVPTPKTYDEDMDVIFLTLKEIESIEKLKLSDDKLINARKWLILGCYTAQRGQTLVNKIVRKNFIKVNKGFKINLIQKKGNKAVHIPVLPKVEKMYLEDNLPYKVNVNTLNKQFQQLGKLAKIDEMILGRKQESVTRKGVKRLRPKYEYITSHTGRRTFINIHLEQGFDREIIMRVTGHTKEDTLLKYMNQSTDNHIGEFLDHYSKK